MLFTITILRREFNHNEQFRVWFQEHKKFGLFIAFCSLGHISVLHVLNCKFNYLEIFNARLSITAEKKIIHASKPSLLADIGQFFFLVRTFISFFKNILHGIHIMLTLLFYFVIVDSCFRIG